MLREERDGNGAGAPGEEGSTRGEAPEAESGRAGAGEPRQGEPRQGEPRQGSGKPIKASRKVPPKVDSALLRAGYAAAGIASSLVFVTALPAAGPGGGQCPSGVDYTPAVALLGVLAALVGAALPDVVEGTKGGLLARLLCGRSGKSLSKLVREAGYRNTVTHSAGALLVVFGFAAALPYVFGPLPGAVAGVSLFLGYAVHVVLDLFLDDRAAPRLPLAWPLAGSTGAFVSRSFARSSIAGRLLKRPNVLGTIIVGPAVLLGWALVSERLFGLWGAGSVSDAPGILAASLAAVPGDALARVAGEPYACAAGLAVLLGGLVAGRSIAPRLEKRVAERARAEKGYTGGVKSFKLVPFKDVEIEPERFGEFLSRVYVPTAEEGGVVFGYAFGGEQFAFVSGTDEEALREVVDAVEGEYMDELSVQEMSEEEAMVLGPPEGHEALAASYEISGERPELGLKPLSEFRVRSGNDPLGGVLNGVLSALDVGIGERGMIQLHLCGAGTVPREALKASLDRYTPDEEAKEREEKKRQDEKDRRYQKTAIRKRHGSRHGGGGADDFLEARMADLLALVGVIVRLTFGLVFGVFKLVFRGGAGLYRLGSVSRGSLGRMFSGGPDRPDREKKEAEIVRRRSGEPAFVAGFSALAYVKSDPRAQEKKRRLHGAFSRYYASFGRSGVSSVGPVAARGERSACEIELRRVKKGLRAAEEGVVIGPAEVAAMFRPLGRGVRIAGRAESNVLTRPLPAGAPKEGIHVADSNHGRQKGSPVFLDFVDLPYHGVFWGRTGMGKSSLQYRMIQSVMGGTGRRGKMGMLLMDPKGGELFAKVMAAVPDHRRRDVVVVDPGDRDHAVPGFNLFVAPESGWITPEDLAAIVVAALEQRWPSGFGNNMRPIFVNGALALIAANQKLVRARLEPRYTLLDLTESRFLQPRIEDENGNFEEQPPVREEALNHLRDDPEWRDVVRYWDDKDRTQSAKDQAKEWNSITNKIAHFKGVNLKRLLGVGERSFDVMEALEEGKIILLNLSQATFVAETHTLVGTIFLNLVVRASIARHDAAVRSGKGESSLREFVIFVDEVQNFQCKEMEKILTEGRSHATPIWAAHQFLNQITDEELREAFANVRTKAFFQATPKDARENAPFLGDPFTPKVLADIAKYNFVMQQEGDLFTCQTLIMPEIDEKRVLEVRGISSRIYGAGGQTDAAAGPDDDPQAPHFAEDDPYENAYIPPDLESDLSENAGFYAPIEDENADASDAQAILGAFIDELESLPDAVEPVLDAPRDASGTPPGGAPESDKGTGETGNTAGGTPSKPGQPGPKSNQADPALSDDEPTPGGLPGLPDHEIPDHEPPRRESPDAGPKDRDEAAGETGLGGTPDVYRIAYDDEDRLPEHEDLPGPEDLNTEEYEDG